MTQNQNSLDPAMHCFREDNCQDHLDHTGPLCCCCGQPAESHSGCDCEQDERTINHCATCGHYREWHSCLLNDPPEPVKAAYIACGSYTTERASDLIDDGFGVRARGGLMYFS